MIVIECNKCYHREFVNEVFASNIKHHIVKCVKSKTCEGNMIMLDKSIVNNNLEVNN